MLKTSQKNSGFTLLEIMLALGTLVIIAGIAVGYYSGVLRNLALGTIQKGVITDLRRVRANAIAGEHAMKWGIHFVNGGTDYYELFRTPTNYADGSTVITETIELPVAIGFTDPTTSSSKDIIFDRTTGTASDTSVSLQENNSGLSATITVSSAGIIE